MDSTQRDPARKLYYSRLFFFFSFFFSPFCRGPVPLTPASQFRPFDPIISLLSHILFSIQHHDFSRLFSRRPFCPRSQQENNRGEQSLNDACQKKSRFPPPLSLSVAVPCFFPTFSPFSSFPPRDLSSLFHLPFNRRPSERLFRCWRVRVTIQVSSLADAKEERIRRMWILSVGRRVSVETVRGAPISSRGLGRAAESTVKNEIKRVELFLKRSNAYIRRVGTPHASARLIVFFFSA